MLQSLPFADIENANKQKFQRASLILDVKGGQGWRCWIIGAGVLKESKRMYTFRLVLSVLHERCRKSREMPQTSPHREVPEMERQQLFKTLMTSEM